MPVIVGLGALVCWFFAGVMFLVGGTDIHYGFAGLLTASGFGLLGIARICKDVQEMADRIAPPEPKPERSRVRKAPEPGRTLRRSEPAA